MSKSLFGVAQPKQTKIIIIIIITIIIKGSIGSCK